MPLKITPIGGSANNQFRRDAVTVNFARPRKLPCGPVNPEPRVKWIDRDDNEIHQLIGLADALLAFLHR